jgi:hypothetical protein
MITEGFAAVVIEASITGAGLVLAVLALVAPLSQKINKINLPEENVKKVKTYLLGAVTSLAITFMFYMLSLFTAYAWFLEPLNQTLFEILLKIFFFLSNATFMIFGYFILTSIYFLMKNELG